MAIDLVPSPACWPPQPVRLGALLLGLSVCWASAALAHGAAAHAGAASAPGVSAQTQDDPTPFGRPGDPARINRTVRLEMGDNMRFSPASLSVRRGETLRLIVVNKGRLMHELVLGRRQDLQNHAEQMRRHPDMEHEAPYMAHVRPGEQGEIVWQFDQPGEFQFACLVPGHFEAGMVGRMRVGGRP